MEKSEINTLETEAFYFIEKLGNHLGLGFDDVIMYLKLRKSGKQRDLALEAATPENKTCSEQSTLGKRLVGSFLTEIKPQSTQSFPAKRSSIGGSTLAGGPITWDPHCEPTLRPNMALAIRDDPMLNQTPTKCNYQAAGPEDLEHVKLTHLSASLLDRVTARDAENGFSSLAASLEKILTYHGTSNTSLEKSETACLKEVQKIIPEYKRNSTVFYSHDVSGTPDAIVERDGIVISCAEFKSCANFREKAQLNRGKTQLQCYLYLFGLKEGHLCLYSKANAQVSNITVVADPNFYDDVLGGKIKLFKQYLGSGKQQKILHKDSNSDTEDAYIECTGKKGPTSKVISSRSTK